MTTFMTQPTYSPLGGVTNTVKSQVGDMMGSGHYYVTPEMGRELRHIDNGVDHIKLDHDFLASSGEWAQRCGGNRTMMEREGAGNAMNMTAQTVHRLKGDMQARDINGRQDNQVRQQHHTAINALRGAENTLAPYAHQSIERIKQYCDHVGVTDRYTGYKSNLNRGTREPVRLGYQWLDDSRRAAGFSTSRSACRPGNTMRQSDPRACMSARAPMPRMEPLTTNSVIKYAPPSSKSVQEQCGINTTFPGRTEYMVRYARPATDRPTVPFTVNPIPQTGAHGRPQASVAWEPSSSEYQWRYEWPDSRKIDKLPWIKKF